MYTGHLLQLLALYETLTGDTRYWTDGWDFVWTDGRRVQYTVRRPDAPLAPGSRGRRSKVAIDIAGAFW